MTKELIKQAKDEIVNILELDNIKINIDKYRADIEMYGEYIFIVSDRSDEVKYSTSIYSTRITKETDEKDRNEYKEILTVFIKLLDAEVSDKIKSILEKYMKLVA